MAELNETPRGNRIHIAFFGLRNAGKSTLVNAFTGQNLAIVSDTPGTTTDPVSKAMEILPLGPCLVTDTAGLDDEGELGAQRVKKSLDVLATTDIAVWVHGEEIGGQRSEVRQTSDRPLSDLEPLTFDLFHTFLNECKRRHVIVLEYHRGDSVEELKKKIAAIKLEEKMPGLLDRLVSPGDRIICVVPIDESAPKGRLILPQQQVIRECLDRHIPCSVCQPEELFDCLSVGLFDLRGCLLVITDSQAFGSVSRTIERFEQSNNPAISLTSFSILFARQKGDVGEYVKGLKALKSLKDGDTVLVAEGCTHHRQCNDIGSVKIPKAIEKLTGKKLDFVFSSGIDFDLIEADSCMSVSTGRADLRVGRDRARPSRTDLNLDHHNKGRRSEVRGQTLDGFPSQSNNQTIKQSNNSIVQPLTFNLQPSLIVHCGGCMLTRREVLRRIAVAKEAGIPIVNYGMVLALVAGIPVDRLSPSQPLNLPPSKSPNFPTSP